MKKWTNILLSALLLCCANLVSEAQSDRLPALAADPAVKKSELPNGITCFMVANPASKGDISVNIVRKLSSDTDLPADSYLERVQDEARRHFAAVRLGDSTLDRFLARNGMLPSSGRYIHVKPYSLTYTLGTYNSARGEAVLDSLLYAVNLLCLNDGGTPAPSSSQALILSGDFDAKAVSAKLKLLSMISPRVAGKVADPVYEWKGSGGQAIHFEGEAASKVVVSWNGPRTPREYMNTVLPVISDKLSGELGWVLRSRLYPTFLSEGIHVWIEYDVVNSSQGSGDESVTLSVGCTRPDRVRVAQILSRELDRLYTWGVDEVEYTYARDGYRHRWMARAKDMSPENYVYKNDCISAFLYGTSLSTELEKIRFAYRPMPDSTQTRLFNRYVAGLLEQTSHRDTTLDRSKPLTTREAMESRLDAYAPQYVIKPPKPKSEYLSGGTMWTFGNGVNLVVKKMDTKGICYYSYAARGGRAYADTDYLTTIDGVNSDTFFNYLASQGIEMTPVLNPADVCLRGSVPAENLVKVLKVLSALSAQKENDKVFGPANYKLLVLVTDQDETAVRDLVASYVEALRPGSKWNSGSVQIQDAEDDYVERSYIIKESSIRLDMNATNFAAVDMACFAVCDALIREFEDDAVKVLVDGSFVGFPSDQYRLVIGVKPISEAYRSASVMATDASLVPRRLKSLLEDLSSRTFTKAELDMYRKMAVNRYQSYRNTPAFYLDMVNDRYLNNKDILSKYQAGAAQVTSADLQKIYATAYLAN